MRGVEELPLDSSCPPGLEETMFATRNKCIASSNKCLTSSNKDAIRNNKFNQNRTTSNLLDVTTPNKNTHGGDKSWSQCFTSNPESSL